jgi:dihydrofolate synthase/folylpolyglutamate synthase
MSHIRNFDDVHTALRAFYRKDTTYTLDRMYKLMEYLGNPQDKLQIVHVAGTSGKTSTAYYVAALLQAAGLEVGLTVSPHVDEVNERVQINLIPLAEADFCTSLEKFIALVGASGITPSYFELMVAFAFYEFAERNVDYAVIEVGLGGLLDGTNVIGRADKVCIITDIGLDHTEVLGNTLGEIATQKAGIIQPNNQVYMYEQSSEIMAAVRTVVDEQHAVLHTIHEIVPPEVVDLPAFQQRNFGLAKITAQYVLELNKRAVLGPIQLQQAAATHIPARMEVLQYDDKTIIIDGAHNAQKLASLLASMQAKYPNQPIAALVGFVDGDRFRLERSLDVVIQEVTSLLVTSFYTEKDYPKHSFSADEVADYCRQKGYTAVSSIPNAQEALTALLQLPEPLLLITGSFYLLNHIRPQLLEQR